MQTKLVVVAGGVISGVGKGVATASIGKILKEYGYRTTLIKIDPYINCDAGTLRPTEHGEVWVTHDGGEIDQDLGTYERFIDEDIPRYNNITTGQVYRSVIERERRGEYLGTTVQFIPHITDEICARIMRACEGYDIAVVEIGGTVGDYENVPFLTALKGLELTHGREHMTYVLVSYLPIPDHIGEPKTKPTQQAIRMLREQGISPDFIICRSSHPLDGERLRKIEQLAHVARDRVLVIANVDTIYRVPLLLEEQAFGAKLLKQLALPAKQTPEWSAWQQQVGRVTKPDKTVRIAVVGKYLDAEGFQLADSYVSVCHALIHAGAQAGVGVKVVWLDAVQSVSDETMLGLDGILVPGGFGSSGVCGKLSAIQYARENGVPYLGLCYGMQLAVVEFARNVCNLEKAHTVEVDPDTPHRVVDILPLQRKLLEDNQYGGTMRLGAYAATLKPGTKVYDLYAASGQIDARNERDTVIQERHRHRYEVNPEYVARLEEKGLCFSGKHVRADGAALMEFLELPDHPFFVATQAHPEFGSRFGRAHPIFSGFVSASARLSDEKVDGVVMSRVREKEREV